MRSFPQAWHVDVFDLPREKVPGGRCFCFGDPHPENFGFITFTVGPRYVFNDLDDAGPGFAALDALRYFTALRLFMDDRKTLDELMELYEDIIQGSRPPCELPDALHPDIAAKDARQLEKWTHDGAFRFDEPELMLSRVPPETGQKLVLALRDIASHVDLEVIEIAHRGRQEGGSGGLDRYLVLARDRAAGRMHLLEFKETTHAATSWSNYLHEEENRLEQAKSSIWRGLVAPCYVETQVGRSVYLLRDRLGRASMSLQKLGAPDLRHLLEAQVSIIARQHAEAFAGLDIEELDEWLRASMKVTAKRWREVYERARG
jgi:hypothetical protein